VAPRGVNSTLEISPGTKDCSVTPSVDVLEVNLKRMAFQSLRRRSLDEPRPSATSAADIVGITWTSWRAEPTTVRCS